LTVCHVNLTVWQVELSWFDESRQMVLALPGVQQWQEC
jgi:hypothetical protein